ncbi:MAG: acyl carrier protein [Ruminiclostridium sp.]|jgi:acyl carrier protein|nr:acyl carrier protein [Ruminiclostridium sp.]
MIFEKLKAMIIEQMGDSSVDITMDTSFEEDLGADSLDLFELLMALDDEFGVEIPEADTENIKTVGDVVNYLQSKLDL